MKEHLWCRNHASLFDVSHMGQIKWHGKDRQAFLEKLVVADVRGLAPGNATLSLVTNPQGGIIDDTVITQYEDYIYMVVNGATKVGDMQHFEYIRQQHPELDVTMEYLEDTMQLLAIQGPQAAQALMKLLPSGFELEKIPFMAGTEVTLGGIPGCRLTRYVVFATRIQKHRHTWRRTHHHSNTLFSLCLTHTHMIHTWRKRQMRIHGRRWIRNCHARPVRSHAGVPTRGARIGQSCRTGSTRLVALGSRTVLVRT